MSTENRTEEISDRELEQLADKWVKGHVDERSESVTSVAERAYAAGYNARAYFRPEPKEISASEAVYGFAAWLTSRKGSIVLGSSEDAAEIAELVKEFCERNNLAECREGWQNNLLQPLGKEEDAKPRAAQPEHRMHGHIAENDDDYDFDDPARRGE